MPSDLAVAAERLHEAIRALRAQLDAPETGLPYCGMRWTPDPDEQEDDGDSTYPAHP
jgi:hypothetical protein